MQTPAGHEMRNGIAYPVDWLAIIFNPSFPYRFAHMLNAAYLTTGFVVLAVGARYLLAGRHVGGRPHHGAHGDRACRRACAAATCSSATSTGSTRSKHQPIKVAAMEAHWDGSKPGDFHIFAWPDEKAEKNRFEISIPRGSSLILTHDPNGLFPGLKSVPPQRAAAGAKTCSSPSASCSASASS